jgi:hypothetical protein
MSRLSRLLSQLEMEHKMTVYDPHDDYTDADLALMDPAGPWPPCTVCGWSPDESAKPHAEFVHENTYCSPHSVTVDPADLA